MKTFDKKDVFSWSNAEDAKQFCKGGYGYFADSLKDLQECVSNNNIQKLFSICLEPETDVDSVFSITESDYYYALFLPEEKVKEVEEKKWRAFETMEEFIKIVGDIGTIITYRTKKEPSQEMKGMFTGDMWDSACRGWILGIGATLYRLENLFELAEYKYKNEWKPFGVQENE